MKRLLIILWLLGMQTSCRFPRNEPQTIRFYHRDRLGDGEVYIYSDYLAISSYENKPATARQLLQVAESYLDTAHAKRPIDEVTFVAKDVETPELIWDSEILGQERKYFLISFDYVHSIFDTVNTNRQLRMITIWNHGEPTLYYQDHAFGSVPYRLGTNLIDSILNSLKPLLNH